jgi:DNA-binding transcriptional ArsR family regulator
MFDVHRTDLFDGCQTMSRGKLLSLETGEAPDLATVDVVTVLQALADPVRLEIVRQLTRCGAGELSCGQIDVPVGKSTASHHLKVLAGAGLTAEREEGTRKYISLRRPELDRRFPGLIELVLKGEDAA